MRGNLQGLLAQAQKMQKNVERIQAELGNLEVVGESGAGLVKITMTCRVLILRKLSESLIRARRFLR